MIPADIIMARFHFLIPTKLLSGGIFNDGSGAFSASPYIATNPPSGIARIEKYVSPFFLFLENNFGPNPIENSSQ